MSIKSIMFGKDGQGMPDTAFRIMSFIFIIIEIFSPAEKRIRDFGIKEGFAVVDYGCGPGRYIPSLSKFVGEKGKVYAADIHKLAAESVKKKIEKFGLKNVEPILINGYSSGINDGAADVICALDMFHMIKESAPFLNELHRIIKKDGFLIIDDGHQSRDKTKTKILSSNCWNISEETKDHLKCTPVH